MTVVYRAFDQAHIAGPTLLTIGAFDGVHVGHQALIHHVTRRAQRQGMISALVTFDPHPRVVLSPERAPRFLQSTRERLETLSALGLDTVVSLQFGPALAQTSAEDFVHLLVHDLQMRELWVGRDFALGHRRQGNVPFLKKLGIQLGFTVHPVRRVALAGERISSSRIRALLDAGEVSAAAHALGRYYLLAGTVVHGAHRGGPAGFPTANLAVATNRLLPADGVYATWVQVAGQWIPGATNVGTRPTFDNGQRTVETHLIDWHGGPMYGQEMAVHFVERLRDERKFAGVDALSAQLTRDVAQAQSILSQTPKILPPAKLPEVEEIT
ncbi:MAG: bifunctional riboflavin kinase/FAD synthetase [Chloroflexi bacterium]|nr:bifunctional riboflavin kinase/FAD synthetase [Chloroflexota bacterium]